MRNVCLFLLIFRHYLVKQFNTSCFPFEPLFDPSMRQRPIFIFHRKLTIRSMTWKYFNVISTLLIHEFGIFYKIVCVFLPTETSKRAIIRSLLGLASLICQKAKYKYIFDIYLLIVSDVFMFWNAKTPYKLHLSILAFETVALELP